MSDAAHRSYATLTYEVRDAIARITLNRPQALNALNSAMARELAEVVTRCAADSSVRAMILTGAGRAFCAGGDLREFTEAGTEGVDEEVRKVLSGMHTVATAFASMDAPVLAAINGVAAGGGLALACACDLLIAAESARFTVAFTRAGLTPDSSSTYYLPRRVGLARALDLALTNRMLSAQEALAWGLVSRITPDDQLAVSAEALASELARGATHALGEAKRLLRASWTASLEDQLERETRTIAAIAATADAQEGMRAFLEKRAPTFTGKAE